MGVKVTNQEWDRALEIARSLGKDKDLQKGVKRQFGRLGLGGKTPPKPKKAKSLFTGRQLADARGHELRNRNKVDD